MREWKRAFGQYVVCVQRSAASKTARIETVCSQSFQVAFLTLFVRFDLQGTEFASFAWLLRFHTLTHPAQQI